jgi:hypothetical protein
VAPPDDVSAALLSALSVALRLRAHIALSAATDWRATGLEAKGPKFATAS